MGYLGASVRKGRGRPWTGWRRIAGVGLSLALNATLFSLVDRDWIERRVSSREPRSVALRPLGSEAWAANRRVESSAPGSPRPPPAPKAEPVPREAAPVPSAAAARPPDRPRPVPEEKPPLPAREDVPAQPPTPQPPPAPPAVQEQLAGRQVVDVEATGKREPPKDARFVSEVDQTVERETVSRFAGAGYERTLSKPTQAETPAPPPNEPGGRTDRPGAVARGSPGGDGLRPGRAGAPDRGDAPRRRSSASDLAMSFEGDAVTKAYRPRADPSPGAAQEARGEGGQGGRSSLPPEPGDGGDRGTGARRASGVEPVLKPTSAFYDKLGGGPFADYIQGVDVGESTVLNTRAWAHAGYMNRVKAAVADAWDPGPEARARDPDGKRIFYKDRATVIRVVLDDKGALRDIQVAQSSGYEFLDELGVEAFRKAQPFHNPPTALVGPQGEFQFYFTFVMTSGPRP
jgi:TonB family protein